MVVGRQLMEDSRRRYKTVSGFWFPVFGFF
jgi:hypothetical protein